MGLQLLLLLLILCRPTLSSIHLKMVYRSPLRLATISHMVETDRARIQVLERRAERQRRRRKYLSSDADQLSSELISASSVGLGQYFVQLELGTPPQKLPLIFDTGSDLTWVRCPQPSAQSDPLFFPNDSSSISNIRCTEPACSLVPAPEPSVCVSASPSTQQCDFAYAYNDHSNVSGQLFRDSVWLSKKNTLDKYTGTLKSRFDNVTFGCAESIDGSSFSGAAGVLGLGRGQISFTMQLISPRLGGAFSYCLVDYLVANASSELTIGRPSSTLLGPPPGPPELKYTPMLGNGTYYYVGIQGVSINRMLLSGINTSQAWKIDGDDGGSIIDSGTTLTFLREPAYSRIMDALTSRIKLPRIVNNSSVMGPFEACYNVSGLKDYHLSMPELSFSLAGQVEFKPPPNNYMVLNVKDVDCIGFLPVTSPSGFNIIGNLLQRNFHFEFDLINSRIGFAWLPCS